MAGVPRRHLHQRQVLEIEVCVRRLVWPWEVCVAGAPRYRCLHQQRVVEIKVGVR
jgi:hypothetical protein